MTTYYVSPGGNDAAPGTAVDRAFRTIAKANAVAMPGDHVQIAAGIYDDAPGRPEVQYTGEMTKTYPLLQLAVVRAPMRATRDMHVSGLAFNGDLELGSGAQRSLFVWCRFRGCSVSGSRDAAATGNLILHSRFEGGMMWGHNYGDDRATGVPYPTGNQWINCDMTFTRPAGTATVLWRWSGMMGNIVHGCKIKLIHPNDGQNSGDDGASMKILYSRNNRFSSNQWEFDHPEGISGGTGPFWMMRDETSYNRFENESYDVLRGGLWFSPNTAGTIICSCKGNTFRYCRWRVKGRMLFYQCTPASSDIWSKCEIRCDEFDRYQARTLPAGIDVRPYLEPFE